MANTRHDPENDLGYIARTYPSGPDVPRKSSKPLTSSQQNYRARRIEAENARVMDQPILEPTADELAAMTPEEVINVKEGLQGVRDFLKAGKVPTSQTVEIEPVQTELFPDSK